MRSWRDRLGRIKKSVVVASAAALLAGCASALHKQMDQETVTVTWHRVSVLEADRMCREGGVDVMPFPLTVVPACAKWKDNTCTIIVPEPQNANDDSAIYLLGHEVLHCFVGEYHAEK